jgi:hypothetical protein
MCRMTIPGEPARGRAGLEGVATPAMEHTKRTGGVSAQVVIAVLLVLAVGGVAIWIVVRRSGPRAVASRYLAAWRDGREDVRRELITPDSRALEDQLTRIVGKMPRAVSYHVGEASVEGDRATVRIDGRIEWQTAEGFGYSGHLAADMVLVRVDRRWRVDSIATLENIAAQVGLPAEALVRQIRSLREADINR